MSALCVSLLPSEKSREVPPWTAFFIERTRVCARSLARSMFLSTYTCTFKNTYIQTTCIHTYYRHTYRHTYRTSGSGCPPGASIIPCPSATPLLRQSESRDPSAVSTTAPTPSFWERYAPSSQGWSRALSAASRAADGDQFVPGTHTRAHTHTFTTHVTHRFTHTLHARFAHEFYCNYGYTHVYTHVLSASLRARLHARIYTHVITHTYVHTRCTPMTHTYVHIRCTPITRTFARTLHTRYTHARPDTHNRIEHDNIGIIY